MSVSQTHATTTLRVQTSLVTFCAHVNRVTLENNVTSISTSVKTNLVSTMAHAMTLLITTPAHAGMVSTGLTVKKILTSVHFRHVPTMPRVKTFLEDSIVSVNLVTWEGCAI